jgi:ABC-type multidrug transport system fused ATPase/permease subunit
VGLVGASGCGKSTIIQLLLRFYEPSEGIILIDGIDIKDYDIDALRRHFGVVSQEATLFDETVRYNILYGNSDASEEQLAKFSNLFFTSA